MTAKNDLRLRDLGIHQPQCSAHTRSGAQCKKRAVTGSSVCNTHGGAAPQVQAAGLRRTADEISLRLSKSWTIVDKALERGDSELAWKIISARSAIEARAEERELKALEAQSRNQPALPRGVDKYWASYADEA